MADPGTLIAGGSLALQLLGMNNKQPIQPVPNTAAARRLGVQPTVAQPTPQPAQMMQPSENLAALEAARFEASQLPDMQRKEYEPPILAALMQARRQEGLV